MRALLFCLAIASLSWPAARAAEEDVHQAFKESKRQLIRLLRSQQASDRAAAFELLSEFPITEAADLAVNNGLGDPSPQVREAAGQLLNEWKNDEVIGAHLVVTLTRQLKRPPCFAINRALLTVLSGADNPAVRQQVIKALDEAIATPSGDLLLALQVIDRLGHDGEIDSIKPLLTFSEARAFTAIGAYRRAVLQALANIDHNEAVAAVMSLMPHIEGEAWADVMPFLLRATHQRFGPNRETWLAWWKENGESFQFAAGEFQPPEGSSSGPQYYGLPLYARRLVFVIDVSGSMEGARLAAAQRELIRAIHALPVETEFSVVAYQSAVMPWQKQLVPASPAAKRNAAQFVARLRADGATATYDAVETAFAFPAEAIYLLTDGKPSSGKVVKPLPILQAVTAFNRMRRVSIYSIGIKPGVPGDVFAEFLRLLSEQNFGQFRRVDQ